MTARELDAFKDGVADALLDGYKCDWHESMHFYKSGYDFGITLYTQMEDEK